MTIAYACLLEYEVGIAGLQRRLQHIRRTRQQDSVSLLQVARHVLVHKVHHREVVEESARNGARQVSHAARRCQLLHPLQNVLYLRALWHPCGEISAKQFLGIGFAKPAESIFVIDIASKSFAYPLNERIEMTTVYLIIGFAVLHPFIQLLHFLHVRICPPADGVLVFAYLIGIEHYIVFVLQHCLLQQFIGHLDKVAAHVPSLLFTDAVLQVSGEHTCRFFRAIGYHLVHRRGNNMVGINLHAEVRTDAQHLRHARNQLLQKRINRRYAHVVVVSQDVVVHPLRLRSHSRVVRLRAHKAPHGVSQRTVSLGNLIQI